MSLTFSGVLVVHWFLYGVVLSTLINIDTHRDRAIFLDDLKASYCVRTETLFPITGYFQNEESLRCEVTASEYKIYWRQKTTAVKWY